MLLTLFIMWLPLTPHNRRYLYSSFLFSLIIISIVNEMWLHLGRENWDHSC